MLAEDREKRTEHLMERIECDLVVHVVCLRMSFITNVWGYFLFDFSLSQRNAGVSGIE